MGGISSAQTLSGTVTNSTSDKPAAGDEVVLIRLAQGMDEVARTKTDSSGTFSFHLDDPGAPHLLRAIHQGVTYHRMAPPGTTSVALQVYDAVQKIQELSVTADVLRIQAEGGSLQVVRRFAVSNSSSPPRTQMNDRNFEFYLPEGAQLDNGMAKTANGQPVNSSPVPQKEKNRYAFIFPLRPGQTEFQVTFHLPYNGSASLDPKTLYPAQHMVVVLPKSMQFSAEPGSSFQSMQDPGQTGATVQVATNTQPGQPLTFHVSGTGVLQDRNTNTGPGAQSENSMGQPRTGNGAPPKDSDTSRGWFGWAVLGGFAIVLVALMIYVGRRRRATSPVSVPFPDLPSPLPVDSVVPTPAPAPAATLATARPSGLLFAALKEELFQLEIEHKQGRISTEEYTQAKSALDRTLEHALKREAKTAASPS